MEIPDDVYFCLGIMLIALSLAIPGKILLNEVQVYAGLENNPAAGTYNPQTDKINIHNASKFGYNKTQVIEHEEFHRMQFNTIPQLNLIYYLMLAISLGTMIYGYYKKELKYFYYSAITFALIKGVIEGTAHLNGYIKYSNFVDIKAIFQYVVTIPSIILLLGYSYLHGLKLVRESN